MLNERAERLRQKCRSWFNNILLKKEKKV